MVATDINTAPALVAVDQLLRARDIAGVRVCLQEALISELDSAPLRFSSGHTHLQLGDLVPAQSAFERGSGRDPFRAPAFVNLALVRDQLKRVGIGSLFQKPA